MATTKKRITISLDDETYYLFKEFARAQKRPIATVITELLQEVSPPLKRTLANYVALVEQHRLDSVKRDV